MSPINVLGVIKDNSFYKHFVPTGLFVLNTVDRFFIRHNNTHAVKRKGSAFKNERPQRAVISEKEALKRMKEFSKRKEQFLATARTGKSRSVRPRPARTSLPQSTS